MRRWVCCRDSGTEIEEDDDPFSYKRLNHALKTGADVVYTEDGLYCAVLTEDGEFIFIKSSQRIGFHPFKGRERIHIDYGLKFHIALPEWDRLQFEHGWEIVKNILIRNRITSFKIVREPYRMSTNSDQRGKDITIYAEDNMHMRIENWQMICEEITRELTIQQIFPGYRPPNFIVRGNQILRENYILSSNYISYRYDNGRNAMPRVDCFSQEQGFIVNVEGQLPIREWTVPIERQPGSKCTIL